MTRRSSGLFDVPAGCAIVGGILGYLATRYVYLPEGAASANWQEVSTTTASGIFFGALVFTGLWNMAVTLAPALRTLLGGNRREHAFLDHLGKPKNKP